MITHDHKLIFVHIPKCAGRSICSFFNQRFDHFTLAYYKKEYAKAFYTYNKFSIVRNPYARLVSIFTYVQSHRRHKFEPIGFAHAITGITQPNFTKWLKANLEAYEKTKKDYGSFFGSAEGLRGEDSELGSPFWFTSQASRLKDNEFSQVLGINPVNILKIEYGRFAIERFIRESTGLEMDMPSENVSNNIPWQDFYDEESKELAMSWEPIIEDCKLFDYNFTP